MDPTTKFNQIDLSNYVGSLSGSTVNTASDFKAALQYILDNNSGKHFYYGTDHKGTTWYFASDTELSTLSNDSYTCGNGVQNNGTAVQETFKMNKYVEPGKGGFTPPEGFKQASQGVLMDTATVYDEYSSFEQMWNTHKMNFKEKNKVYWDSNNGSTAITSDSYGTIKTAIGTTTFTLNEGTVYVNVNLNNFAAYVNGKWRYWASATVDGLRLL